MCCRDTKEKTRLILLLKLEVERISKKTRKSVVEFAERIEKSEPYIYQMKKSNDGKCIFLKDNLCSIYNIRPLICMFYPFELKEIKSNQHLFVHTTECPSIGKGPELKRSYFETLYDKFKKTMKDNKKALKPQKEFLQKQVHYGK